MIINLNASMDENEGGRKIHIIYFIILISVLCVGVWGIYPRTLSFLCQLLPSRIVLRHRCWSCSGSLLKGSGVLQVRIGICMGFAP